jgi:cell division protein FtsN
VGPVDAREEAEDIQGKLGAAGIDSNLVRVER